MSLDTWKVSREYVVDELKELGLSDSDIIYLTEWIVDCCGLPIKGHNHLDYVALATVARFIKLKSLR